MIMKRVIRIITRLGLIALLIYFLLGRFTSHKDAAQAGAVPNTTYVPEQPPTPADAAPRIRAQRGYAPRAELVRLPHHR
jgi:hypothetical protein